jgi:hypothetical protein
VKSDVLLVEVDCVFASGNCEIDIEKGGQGLTCELPDLGPLNNLLIDLLSSALLLLLLVILVLHFILCLLLLLGLLNMEADFTHAVVVANLVRGSFDDYIILVDGGVVDGIVADGKDGVLASHAQQSEGGLILSDSTVVYPLERHLSGKYSIKLLTQLS